MGEDDNFAGQLSSYPGRESSELLVYMLHHGESVPTVLPGDPHSADARVSYADGPPLTYHRINVLDARGQPAVLYLSYADANGTRRAATLERIGFKPAV